MSEVALFDPISPGVTRQSMIDWIYLHHPHTTIKPRSDTNAVAVIVRKLQPKFFPNPHSTAPAVIPTNVSRDGKKNTTNSATSISLHVDHFQGQTSQLKTESSPSNVLKPSAGSGRRKRVASHELNDNPKLVKFDVEDIKPDITNLKSLSKKKAASRITKSVRAAGDSSIGALSGPSIQSSMRKPASEPKPVHVIPSRDHEAPELVFHPPGGIRPEVLNTPEIKDLIDINFSDTNILDSPNFEIGRKIPVMLTGILNRTGVDVFQEERNRENQIHTLEESVSKMVEKMEESNAEAVRFRNQLEKLDYTSHLLESTVGQLEKKGKVISLLEEKIADLEKQVMELRLESGKAREDIQAHGDALVSLMAGDEDEDEEAEDHGSSSEASGFNL